MDWFAVSSPESLCIIQLRKHQRLLLGQERGEDVPLRALSGRKENSPQSSRGMRERLFQKSHLFKIEEMRSELLNQELCTSRIPSLTNRWSGKRKGCVEIKPCSRENIPGEKAKHHERTALHLNNVGKSLILHHHVLLNARRALVYFQTMPGFFGDTTELCPFHFDGPVALWTTSHQMTGAVEIDTLQLFCHATTKPQ